MIDAAKDFPDVQFFHATGTKAHTAGVSNYHNAFASIYEGRYLAGVAAGLKIKEMAENNKLKPANFDENQNVKIGYVGAFTYAEVVSGLTSFYLGVKSQYDKVVMDVQFTGSWYDEAGEREAANTLIDRGVALLSQHADSWGAPNACENAGIPNVSYNGSTINACPDTFIVSSKIDWTYYFKWIIASVGSDAQVEDIPTDFAGGLGESCMVAMSNLNGDVMANNTLAVLQDVRTKLMNGTIKVFDCSKFTVEGNNLTTYLADLDGDYVGDTNVIKTENGITYFAESHSDFRSAPYFDIKIDGINFLNTKF
jgi:basic membrane protein A